MQRLALLTRPCRPLTPIVLTFVWWSGGSPRCWCNGPGSAWWCSRSWSRYTRCLGGGRGRERERERERDTHRQRESCRYVRKGSSSLDLKAVPQWIEGEVRGSSLDLKAVPQWIKGQVHSSSPHRCCGPRQTPPQPSWSAPWTPGLLSWGPGGSGSCTPRCWHGGSAERPVAEWEPLIVHNFTHQGEVERWNKRFGHYGRLITETVAASPRTFH